MADYINQITATDGTTYDVVDSISSPYIVGTQTASTNAWKGVAPFATLTAGQQIRYYLPYAGTSTAATLNLTLSDGTTTGAIALRRLATSTVTTQFAAGCVLYLTYDGTYWKTSAYYDTNSNSIGYQLRTNSSNRTAYEKGYRYRLWFTSADGTKWIPANTSTSTNATTARTANTTPIDPFGDIVYNSTNGSVAADAALATGTQWQQYALSLGYSFTDALPLTAGTPVYLKCLPNSNGSAVMQGTTQTLPSTNDGFIYIYLGQAYSTTAIELRATHPVYWHDGTGIRIWTGAVASSGAETDPVFTASAAHGITSTDITNWNGKSDLKNLTDGSGTSALKMNTLCTAHGDEAVSFGFGSSASGDNALACGYYATAQRKLQTVIGTHNEPDATGADGTEKGDYVFIIGNGTSIVDKSNALTVDWSGNTVQQGSADTADMSSQEVSDFVDALNVTGINAVDYIVEQGTSGIWTYRKWNSGIAECWGSDAKTTSVAGNGYLEYLLYLPTFLINEVPIATGSGGATGHVRAFLGYTKVGGSSGAYNIDSYILNFDSSASAASWVNFYVKGKWK